MNELATFAGGCFWCMQPTFDNFNGVISTIVGYSGGREAIRVEYDETKVSYNQLLELYLAQIDPTDDGPIVVKVEAFEDMQEAEYHHQKYYQTNSEPYKNYKKSLRERRFYS